MSISPNADLIDIVEQLKFQNSVIQAQGFSQLLERLKTSAANQKETNEVNKVLFDCLYAYGSTPQQWIIEMIPYLIGKDKLFTGEQFFDEVLIRLNKIVEPDKLLIAMLEHCDLPFSVFLKIAKKVDSDSLVRVFSDNDMLKRNVQYLEVLLFWDVLTEHQKQQLGNSIAVQGFFSRYFPELYSKNQPMDLDLDQFSKNCSNTTLLTISLEKLGAFQKLKLIQERQTVLTNESLRMHVLFLPELINIMQSRQIVMRTTDVTKSTEETKNIRLLIANCQKFAKIEILPSKFDANHSMESLFNFIVGNQKIDSFIAFMDFYFEKKSLFKSDSLLMFIVSLLPYCKNDQLIRETCSLIVKFVQKLPHQANTLVLYFISLFAKPFFEIERSLVIETMVNLAVNRFVITPIVKFLCAMSQQPIKELCQIYESLGNLVEKYPTIYETVVPIVKNVSVCEKDDKLFLAKLSLAKKCCLATDDCDDLIAVLSQMLKENGFRLASTIDIIIDLCKNDVLEFKTVRRQLVRKVENPVNETALESYCRLLALGTVPDKEETEEVNKEMRVECIKELYQLTKHRNEKISENAWRSLGSYLVEEIEETLKIHVPSIVLSFSSMRKGERIGFVDCLNEFIEKEIEFYPKPLYNLSSQTVVVPPLFSKIDTYKDMMLTKNKEEPWFWRATLPLTTHILQLTSPSNKALTTVRMIKSCATMISPSNSHEDMIQLVASWRICMRESLNCLAQSRNNDILWARDQICEEGKRCLLDCSQSVDNIMMMLTTLADIIDEKLRNIEDKNQVDQIVKSQKPWIISVFEFCTTRLPKDLKQKREQKANPIYQMLTQSTKSSLHIAIFCVRLLYRNPQIYEFYGNGDDLILIKDKMFIALLQDSSVEVPDSEFPERKMLWISSEAYGSDPHTTEGLEALHYRGKNSESESVDFDVLIESLKDSTSIQTFLTAICSSSRELKLDLQTKSKKILEKLWNNGDEDVKKAIYCGLSELELCSSAGNAKMKKLLAVEKLPENSILRYAYQSFNEKFEIDEEGLQLMTKLFISHRRSDGRLLPSLDWVKIMKKTNWEHAGNSELRKNILILACEQSIEEVINKIVNIRDIPLTDDEIRVLARHLPSISKVLPRKCFVDISKKLIRTARKNADEELCCIIAENQSNPIIKNVLTSELPALDKIQDLTDPMLNSLREPQEFVGSVSSVFDFWAEARTKEAMKMKRLCDLYTMEEDLVKRNCFLAILALHASELSEKQRFEKVLDVITSSRIARSSSNDMSSFLPIILSVIVSTSSEIGVPDFNFDSEENIQNIICEISHSSVRKLVKSKEMADNVKHLSSFVLPYFSGQESEFYESWQREVAKDLFLCLLSNYSSQVMPLVENESDDFWNNLIN